MNKSHLINAVAKKSGMKKKDAEVFVNDVFDIITATLAKGEKVRISGFGTFESKCRAARIGRNPQTHEAIDIPAFKSPSFTSSVSLKAELNK